MKYQSLRISGINWFSWIFNKNPTEKLDKPVGKNTTKDPLVNSSMHKIKPKIIQKSEMRKYSNILLVFKIWN